jgi:2-dehydro-3-deoxyphosphogluconate aldolase/(4S)-4-hydroxy-2-oxoglutarate aldolase
MAEALAELSRIGLVPVITIDNPRDAVPLAEALLDGGIGCAEVTFRTQRRRRPSRASAAHAATC